MSSCGYYSQQYLESFEEFGELISLPGSGLSLIRRPIDADHFDIVGLYPFSVCSDWSLVPQEIDSLRDSGLVSVILVSDPFAEAEAQQAFAAWELCKPFKTQFVIDLQTDWRNRQANNIRKGVRQALRRQEFDLIDDPAAYADLFWTLYRQTITRHGVMGIQQLSKEAIAKQLELDGAQMVIAKKDGAVIGAILSYLHGNVANLHLVGHLPEGYRLRTSYGLIHCSLEMLEAKGCRLANIGGPAGLSDDPSDGLYLFKSRWTELRRRTLLCGKILCEEAYRRLYAQCPFETDFFPAYRAPGGPFEWFPVESAS